MVREKIRAGVLIDRVQKHAMGEVEMTATQLAAANTLLDRSVPKLSQIQHVGDENNPVRHAVSVSFVGTDTRSV